LSAAPGHRLARLSIALTAIAFGAFGLLLLVRPEALEVVGVQIARPAGAVELRGFYGGLELGLAVFFALALGRPTWHVPALVVQVGALGGAVAGRLIGLVVVGGWEPWIAALLIAEAGGAALGALALVGLKRPWTSGTPTAPRRSRKR
jgi:hypothetical protein